MKIIGHRGARGLVEENTIPSYERAIELGVDMIELDVRLTSDGVPIIAHDPELDGHVIARAPLERFKITNFYDAVLAINRRVPIYVEIKPGVTPEPVFAVIAKFLNNGWQAEDFLIGSFDQAILRKAHAALPDIQRIVIEGKSALRAMRRAREAHTTIIAMSDRRLWSGLIRALSRRGFTLYSYPKPKYDQAVSNDPRHAAKWAAHGLAGVVTDYPDRFAQ